MHRAKLLEPRPIPLTAGDIPVATDVLLHNLERFTLEALRRAVEQGLAPSGLDFTGDDDSIAILRFSPSRAGKARLMASVEFYPKDNEVVGKVYGAYSQIKYATEPRDARLAGSARQTGASRLLVCRIVRPRPVRCPFPSVLDNASLHPRIDLSSGDEEFTIGLTLFNPFVLTYLGLGHLDSHFEQYVAKRTFILIERCIG